MKNYTLDLLVVGLFGLFGISILMNPIQVDNCQEASFTFASTTPCVPEEDSICWVEIDSVFVAETLNKFNTPTVIPVDLYKTSIWFLKVSESLRLEDYYCPANRRTTGWGHLLDEDENYGTLTVAQADSLFKLDFEKAWNYTGKTYPCLAINQRWAIALLLYNVGIHGIEGSNLDRYLREGKYKKAARRLLKYNRARKCKTCPLKVMGGLTKKRKFEAALLLGDYEYIKPWETKGQKLVQAKIAKAIRLAEA